VVSTRALSGAKMPRCSATLLLVGGPVLGSHRGLLFGSLEMTALAFGCGVVHWGWASFGRA
jgi:hypothetical protein